jgi:MoaA/NifB/PqqE/SkfB family radical SAM enzyme
MSKPISDCQVNVKNFEVLRSGPAADYIAMRFDPNDTCNLHCVYCHNARSLRTIDTENFRHFLAEKVLNVEFFQIGCLMEPTLDKRLVELIEIIGRSPARPSGRFMLQTNGLLLHRHDAGRMAAAGLTNLSVSLDTADPDMQRDLRGGMSLAKVMRNITTFRNNAPTVELEFIAVVTSANVAKMDTLVDLALESGAIRVVFREVFYYPEIDIVDHSRMPSLLLSPDEFKEMEQRIRARYENRLELVFAPNAELQESAERMFKDSRLAEALLLNSY